MKQVSMTLLVLLLASCAEAPKPVAPATITLPPPARVVIVKVPVPVLSPATVPIGGEAPATVLRESATTVAEASRYVAWKNSKLSNINALTTLTTAVSRNVAAMRASKKHGHYSTKEVLAAQASVDALTAFLANKGD